MNLASKLSMEHNGKVYSWVSMVVVKESDELRYLVLDVPYTLSELEAKGITVVNYFPSNVFNSPDLFYPPTELADLL